MRKRIRAYLLIVVLLVFGGRVARIAYENVADTRAWANISGDYSRLSSNQRQSMAQDAERQRRKHGKGARLSLPEDTHP
jgi:hypothetical protein